MATGRRAPVTAASGEATATIVVASAWYRAANPSAPHSPAAAPQSMSAAAGGQPLSRAAAARASNRPAAWERRRTWSNGRFRAASPPKKSAAPYIRAESPASRMPIGEG